MQSFNVALRTTHYIEEIENLVITTFAQRWAIFLNASDFYLTIC